MFHNPQNSRSTHSSHLQMSSALIWPDLPHSSTHTCDTWPGLASTTSHSSHTATYVSDAGSLVTLAAHPSSPTRCMLRQSWQTCLSGGRAWFGTWLYRSCRERGPVRIGSRRAGRDTLSRSVFSWFRCREEWSRQLVFSRPFQVFSLVLSLQNSGALITLERVVCLKVA